MLLKIDKSGLRTENGRSCVNCVDFIAFFVVFLELLERILMGDKKRR